MPAQIDIKEVHRLLDIAQCIDVGVVVLDRQYRLEVWNAFMENHSGLGPPGTGAFVVRAVPGH